MKKIIVITLIFASSISIAQQDAQYTYYMFNTTIINPAYAGSRGVMSVFGLHRNQWVGLPGAPTTNAFSINTPINNSKLGVGLAFLNDRIGPTDENTLSVDVSYTIDLNEKYELSFGLKTSANLFNLDVNKLDIFDQTDPQFQNLRNNFTPNFGAGLYLHSETSYLGLSIPNFFQTIRYDDNDVAVNQERMNFYLIGGYIFDLTYNLKFKPAFLTKVVEGAPLQLDISANFLYEDKFMLGIAWRWGAAVSALAGFQITDGLFIGYAHDRETTRLRRFNQGSNEIFVRFELFNNYSRIVSPRFF